MGVRPTATARYQEVEGTSKRSSSNQRTQEFHIGPKQSERIDLALTAPPKEQL
jgi:hypothetical protein